MCPRRNVLLITLVICLLQACAGTHRTETPAATSAIEVAAPGTSNRSLQFGGLTRTYRLHVPPSYNKSKAVSLVLAFHGRGGTGEAMAKLSSLDEVSDRNNFIVCYPDGVGRSWNAGHGTGPAERQQVDDVGFTSRLIDDLARDFHIDRQRVYATGMSNGAMFVHRLACELADKIAAIAPVAGTIPDKIASNCKPLRPVSVIELHGTSDPDSPWDGGRTLGGGQVESVTATIQGWAERDHCSSTPKVTSPAQDVSYEIYTPCQRGTEVSLYRIENGGHTWPGGYQYLPRVLVGETTHALNASQAIWDFFEKHPLQEH